MAILLLNGATAHDFLVPQEPPAELAHAANFERFDGYEALVNNDGGTPVGANYGATPRPGQRNQPLGQVFTRSALSRTVGTIGGQPLPVANWLYRVGRGYTPSRGASHPQFRLGVGQNYQGVAQTVTLSEITNNPPVPGDLSGIIAGFG
jgi:hypothetical protein